MTSTRDEVRQMRAPLSRRITREEYDRLADQGILTPDDKVELIEGELVPKVQENVPHAVSVTLVQDALQAAFDPGCHVRPGLPVVAGDDSEPESDLAVLGGRPRDYANLRTHPASSLLVVEISDSTLSFDRRRKAQVYARAGFPEYWIVNLLDRVVEVHRDPTILDDKSSDPHYQSLTVYREGDEIIPIHAPSARVPVADLLP